MGFFLIIIIIILVVAAAGIKIVPQAKASVVERLGAYDRTMETGLHYKFPIIDRIAIPFLTFL